MEITLGAPGTKKLKVRVNPSQPGFGASQAGRNRRRPAGPAVRNTDVNQVIATTCALSVPENQRFVISVNCIDMTHVTVTCRGGKEGGGGDGHDKASERHAARQRHGREHAARDSTHSKPPRGLHPNEISQDLVRYSGIFDIVSVVCVSAAGQH